MASIFNHSIKQLYYRVMHLSCQQAVLSLEYDLKRRICASLKTSVTDCKSSLNKKTGRTQGMVLTAAIHYSTIFPDSHEKQKKCLQDLI